MEEIKKQTITCNKCGKTRDYPLFYKTNYCTQCGIKFNFLVRLYNRIKLFCYHTHDNIYHH